MALQGSRPDVVESSLPSFLFFTGCAGCFPVLGTVLRSVCGCTPGPGERTERAGDRTVTTEVKGLILLYVTFNAGTFSVKGHHTPPAPLLFIKLYVYRAAEL